MRPVQYSQGLNLLKKGARTTAMLVLVVAIVVGIALGSTGPMYAALGAYSIIPWGIVGLALGYWGTPTVKRAALVGAVYGFALCFSFMVAGYTGADPVISKLPFFAIIGAFGAVCGVASTLTGYALKRQLGKSRP